MAALVLVEPPLEPATPQDIASYIVYEANRIDYEDPLLALNIVASESNFQNICNRQYGCIAGIGYFQIVRSTFKSFCDGDVFNGFDNLRCGIKILKESGHHHWDMSAFGHGGWYKNYVSASLMLSRIMHPELF